VFAAETDGIRSSSRISGSITTNRNPLSEVAARAPRSTPGEDDQRAVRRAVQAVEHRDLAVVLLPRRARGTICRSRSNSALPPRPRIPEK
jgi:hypothetical protein